MHTVVLFERYKEREGKGQGVDAVRDRQQGSAGCVAEVGKREREGQKTLSCHVASCTGCLTIFFVTHKHQVL